MVALEMVETVGSIIKRYRLAKGLTQEEVADRGGLERSYVNQLENDRVANPGRAVLAKLARGLGERPDIFFEGLH